MTEMWKWTGHIYTIITHYYCITYAIINADSTKNTFNTCHDAIYITIEGTS